MEQVHLEMDVPEGGLVPAVGLTTCRVSGLDIVGVFEAAVASDSGVADTSPVMGLNPFLQAWHLSGS